MMDVAEGVYTRKVAGEVGSAIAYMIANPQEDRFFKLELVRYKKDKAEDDWTELFRPVETPEDRVIELANGHELIRCITIEGRRIDIIFGDPAERDVEPAIVLLAPASE